MGSGKSLISHTHKKLVVKYSKGKAAEAMGTHFAENCVTRPGSPLGRWLDPSLLLVELPWSRTNTSRVHRLNTGDCDSFICGEAFKPNLTSVYLTSFEKK